MEVIGIVGAGTMGTDIACLAAESGFEVLVYDAKESQRMLAKDNIAQQISEHASENNQEPADILNRISFLVSVTDLKGADIVIECVTERENLKKDIFMQLDRLCKPGAVLASNTSSISLTAIAAVTRRPESVMGIHFLNPTRSIKIVELIAGLATTRETMEIAKSFVKKLEREYVVAKDFPGYFLDRMLVPMLNEAMTLLYEGAGTVETIDKVMKSGFNLPQGPLEFADTMGLDTLLAIAEQMYRGYADPKYRPCPLLKQYVAAGYLGKKTGRGFYIYS